MSPLINWCACMKLPQIYISVQKFNCCSKVKNGQPGSPDSEPPEGGSEVGCASFSQCSNHGPRGESRGVTVQGGVPRGAREGKASEEVQGPTAERRVVDASEPHRERQRSNFF